MIELVLPGVVKVLQHPEFSFRLKAQPAVMILPELEPSQGQVEHEYRIIRNHRRIKVWLLTIFRPRLQQ
jgi:hypothetical protein